MGSDDLTGTAADVDVDRGLGLIYAGFGLLVVFYMLFVIGAVGFAKHWWQALAAVAVATVVLLLGLCLTAYFKRIIDTKIRLLLPSEQV